jgi:iron complex outermembrane recepter protein
MRSTILISAILSCTLLHAEDSHEMNLNEIPVTANPLSLSSDELVNPAQIFIGNELQNMKDSSLGAVLDGVPGITNNSWGDSVGQPVIRGMDSNRIKILNNGMEIKDVANMSGDHAVAIDTLSTEQIELIRGPVAILYGGGAVGGVINIIDHRIHSEYIDGPIGKYDQSFGGANNEVSSAFSVDYGFNDNLMFHFDGYKRDTKNTSVPGFSVSEKLAESDSEFARDKYGKDTLQSSDFHTGGGSLGMSHFFNDGYTGFAFTGHRVDYGNVLEDGAKIDLASNKYDYVLEKNGISPLISKMKFKLGYSDYNHKELEPDGAVGTDYIDKGTDAKLQFVHSFFNKSPGVLGFDFGKSNFSKSQGDPLIANNQRKNFSFYLLEDHFINDHKISVGFRHDFNSYQSNDFVSDDGCSATYTSTTDCSSSGGTENSTTFGTGKKTFNSNNLTLGTSSELNKQWTLSLNLSHSERAPAHNELYSFGHHHATETIEQGSRDLKRERSHTVAAQFQWSNQKNSSFSFSPYYTDFQSYIGLLNSGTTQNHLHEGEEDSEALAVYKYTNIPAKFYGFEVQGGLNLSNNYALNMWGDFVRAKNKDGGNLPRIPPVRIGSGLSYQWNTFSSSLDLMHVFNQSHIGAYELKTDDYTNLKLTMNYQLPMNNDIKLYLKGDNLLDEEKRDHVSFLKDKVLMGGRSLMIGVTGGF